MARLHFAKNGYKKESNMILPAKFWEAEYPSNIYFSVYVLGYKFKKFSGFFYSQSLNTLWFLRNYFLFRNKQHFFFIINWLKQKAFLDETGMRAWYLFRMNNLVQIILVILANLLNSVLLMTNFIGYMKYVNAFCKNLPIC